MRTLGKVLLVLEAVLGFLAMLFGGLFMTFWGFVDQYASHYTYKVGFKHPGDDCGNNELAVDLTDGAPLECSSIGVPSYGTPKVDLPGFSDEQDDEVLQLSTQLGAGGFTAAEREQLQGKVDQIVASLPPERLPQRFWLWGWKLGTLGLMVLAPPAYLLFIWPRRGRGFRTQVRRSPRRGAHR